MNRWWYSCSIPPLWSANRCKVWRYWVIIYFMLYLLTWYVLSATALSYFSKIREINGVKSDDTMGTFVLWRYIYSTSMLKLQLDIENSSNKAKMSLDFPICLPNSKRTGYCFCCGCCHHYWNQLIVILLSSPT